jgi:hypothetical protein
MTSVSRFPPSSRSTPAVCPLARQSHPFRSMPLLLAIATSTGLTGCLLSPPADYEEEPLIPPRLEVFGEFTEPTPYLIHERQPGDSIEFKIRVQSNDVSAAGETPLMVILFRNFNGWDPTRYRRVDLLAPATDADGPRDIRVNYTFVDETDGCYQYTLAVTHADNGDPPNSVDRPEDVALVTWWVNIETDDEPNDLRDCLTEGRQ